MRADLARARELAFASDEEAAHALLMQLVPAIEQADRDDQMSEVFAQLGEIFLARSANDQAAECAEQLDHVLTQYAALLTGTHPDPPAELTLSVPEVEAMIEHYAAWPHYLECGVAAARGNHEGARSALASLEAVPMTGHVAERRHLVAHARIRCADALCEDDRYAAAIPLWEEVIAMVDEATDDLWGDRLLVSAGLGYGRFCVETGRLAEAEPWLRRAGARAEALGWPLEVARSQLERGIIHWTNGDLMGADQLYVDCSPVLAEHSRAHDVSRVWYQSGLIALKLGDLERVEQSWDEAERHWREIDRPLQVYRLLLQRSWVPIFRGDFPAAVEYIAQAREVLETWSRSTWLQHARLDFQLGMVWRADALADLGFDTQGELAVYSSRPGSRKHRRAMTKLEQAADLIIPAALAIDAERHAIADPAARARWATSISAPMYAGAFAIAYSWENTRLIAELVEHHSVRGAFDTAGSGDGGPIPEPTDLPIVVLPEDPETPKAARRPAVSLTRLGPAPALMMDPGGEPVLGTYRELATARYGRTITSDEPIWRTWP